MSEPKDPEKLLADALRAQAVFAPSTERLPETTSDKPVETDTERSDVSGKSELPPQYGLLSGAGADSLERERVALEDAETARLAERPTPPPPVSPPLPAYWVLLLAVLLGLAAGSVIGLLTLI
ncbi:hypothetical protein [Amycolatopsis keratiniphila]|uniref:hypothetical protein n=1 Tax=Amycolatopsis keratiniphila TaxID=129921 RepID=UPI00087A5260|nr:hypothetical protein [Amycolatopsis keratiniphila]OLZ60143.1 hypothetical protein BS330_07350 [Amycolatopsis keratiniphila subsp. nogabecina]SDU57769.1 hypothetical protein SAMN04489733_6389 [Amycolatopsis keratiniphila]